MKRPPFEVADIVRMAGSKFRQRYWRALTWPQIKVLRAIVCAPGARKVYITPHLGISPRKSALIFLTNVPKTFAMFAGSSTPNVQSRWPWPAGITCF
jgi:hypothetical protein